MKTPIPFLIFVALLFGCAPAQPSGGKKSADKPPSSVDILVVGDIDKEILGKVRKALERCLLIETSIETYPKANAVTMAKLAAGAPAAKGQARVILSSLHGKETQHAFVDVTNQVGVVNLVVLQDENQETFFRRVERHTNRIAAFSLHRAACPNPFCVLSDYKDLKQLDALGRNLCPPCQMFHERDAKKNNLNLRPREVGPVIPAAPPPKNTPAPNPK